MTPAKLLSMLMISIPLLITSCGSPPEAATSESSRGGQREETAATAPPTETAMEKTTSAPEKTVGKTVREKPSKEKPRPKRAQAEKVVEVEVRGLEYVPSPITVSPGTTVRWVNGDRALHTVTSEGPGGPLDSKELEKGDSFEHMFREPGQYDYYCVVHPFMKSGVTVE